MPGHHSPELVDLFTTYTAAPDSIGSALTRSGAADLADAPLVVATSADLALYPGGGRPPSVEGFRLSTRGFTELAAVSHLGPAVATLVQLRERGRPWRPAAQRLLEAVERSRAVNTEALWRDTIAVEAYRGREAAIADMADYTFDVTARYLRTALADEGYPTALTLRRDLLRGEGQPDLPVPLDHVMIATFFLTGMDVAHRVLRWFDAQAVDWERAMVVIAGRQGRPTAGVTWQTSSVAAMVLGASRHRLPLDRMYLAPHAPVFPTPPPGDLSGVAALEQPLRQVWANTRASVELAGVMFADSPRYSPGLDGPPDLSDPAVVEISEMPLIHGPQDWRALTARLRMVMEDPRQLLSGCVTDYAVAELVKCGNDPARVVVPGLDGEAYPRRSSS